MEKRFATALSGILSGHKKLIAEMLEADKEKIEHCRDGELLHLHPSDLRPLLTEPEK